LVSDALSVSSYGGGVYSFFSSATLNGNYISSNAAAQCGAGLYLDSGSAILDSNIISGNTVSIGSGGGLAVVNSSATLTNTVIADNQSARNGGGMYAENATGQFWHTTIARNVSGDGSGLYVFRSAPDVLRASGTSNYDSAIALTNTILVSQTVGITVTQGNTATLNGVLWYGNAINYGGPGAIAVTNDITSNPAFAADGYHLNSGSAAINAGVASGVAADIDSEPRVGAPDLGADECVLRVFLPIVLRQ
jgi:hypothetical protein